jgi:hypothetical protein
MQHAIRRGIEHHKVFGEDSYRDGFLKRSKTILSAGQTACYARALLPNPVH